MAQDLVALGRVVKAHGIRGEVVVYLLSDVPGRLDAGAELRLDGRPAKIASSRPHQGRILVRFEGVHDRTAAERLRGQLIEGPPADVSESETYFVHELIGMDVVDEDGAALGMVTALIELPDAAGYDLLEVERSNGDTWLLPAAEDFVEVQDVAGIQRLRLVDPPEGLLDPDNAPVAGPPDSGSQGD